MSDTATTSPAVTTPAAEAAPPPAAKAPAADEGPKDPKAEKRAAFQKEIEELKAKDQAEKAAAKEKQPPKQKTAPEEKEPGKEGKAAKDDQDDTADLAGRKFKVEVDGEEHEFTIAEMKRLVGLEKASTKRFEAASRTEQQVKKFFQALKENPRAVLSHEGVGINLRQLAEEVMWEDLQQSLKTPEDLKADEEKAQWQKDKEDAEKYRKEKAEREEKAKKARFEELKEKHRAEWSQKFTEALNSSGLPKTDWTLGRMAAYMQQALRRGMKNVQPADVVDKVRQDWVNAQNQMIGNLDEDKLIDMLGPDAVEKVRKALLKKFQDGGEPAAPRGNSEQANTKQDKVYRSVEEMMRS